MVVLLVSTEDREHLVREHLVMTLLQDNHGDLHGQVVLVRVENLMVAHQVLVVLRELYLVLEDQVHGVTVQLQDQAVVSQVYFTMEL
tara:strand:+ start:173 stop:433 length:261 start_codon:yes stop_codon:yes gene_type:complete